MAKKQLKGPSGSQKPGHLAQSVRNYLAQGSWWRKFQILVLLVVFIFVSSMYGIGQWYIHKHSKEPVVLGTSFISEYAQSFGVDPKATLEAIFSDLGIRQVRLVSYWDQIEPTPGKYDFSGLDWQFAMAEKYGANVSLSIGMRQPRWPECHTPEWALKMAKTDWQLKLFSFMKAVVDRYKTTPMLADYELENEFFMKVFGECKDFDRQRLITEYKMVKQWDRNHKVIISRSDNWIGIPVGQPTPDEFAISVYKRVWDATFTHRYFEYPLPPWFYSALVGSEELLSGKNTIIHELQAEPWAPNGLEIINTPVAEQFKSMNAERMRSRIAYGEATGMKTIDLWGAEWWYWLKEKKGDPSVWNEVKKGVATASTANSKLQNSKSK